MTTKEKIEFYTCNLEDRARNMWKVIEVSDLQDIMETYHQEQVKKLIIQRVSKCECGETKDLITVCEDCTYKMVSEGN
jgi:hypothetical protein